MNFKVLLVLSSLIVGASFGFFSAKPPTVVNVTPSIIDKTVNPAVPFVIAAIPSSPKDIASSEKHISRLVLKASQVIFINGPIGVNAASIVDEIHSKAKVEKELYLLIDSPGGSVMDGSLVVSAIEASPAKVHTVCMGLCASMAFIIHQYGSTRLAVDRTMLMAHPAAGGLRGSLEEMASQLKTITRYVDKADAYIAKRSGISFVDFKAQIVSQKWIDAEDARDAHLVDELVDVDTDAKPSAVPPNIGDQRKQYTAFDLVNFLPLY